MRVLLIGDRSLPHSPPGNAVLILLLGNRKRALSSHRGTIASERSVFPERERCQMPNKEGVCGKHLVERERERKRDVLPLNAMSRSI